MKITKRQLRKLIQEAMYNPRAKRDFKISKLDPQFRNKIKDMVDGPDPLNVASANELVHSLAGYEPSPEYPDAPSYTEEIGQFDRKMKELSFQNVENSLSDEDRKLRKAIVDYLFDPQGDYRVPLDSLTNVNTTAPGGFFRMHFMVWSEIIPPDYVAPYLENWGENPEFEASVERVFNSMGGSYYNGDGDTLVPLPGLSQQDQEYYNQVILKVFQTLFLLHLLVGSQRIRNH